MKKIIVLAISVAALFCACNKETVIDTPAQQGKTVLTIAFPETKTILGDKDSEGGRQTYWADGDIVNVNGENSNPLSNVPVNCTSTSFTFNKVIDSPFRTVYPSTIFGDITSVNLPQTATQSILPLAGKSSSTYLILHPLTSAIKLKIKGDGSHTHAIKRIEISSETQQLSGPFNISYSDSSTEPTLTASSSPSDANKTVAINVDWTPSSTAEEFIIPVPAGTYAIKVKITDENGHFMTQTSSEKTYTKGTIKSFPELTFTPTGTEVIISTAQELVDFAVSYNNKEFAGVNTPLLVTLADDINDWTNETTAAFNATGGIGLKSSYYGDAEDYYFDGIFNGGDHTISGLNATVPLFKATSAGAQINNLTVDNTCSFTFTHNKEAEMDAGAVVAYHRGSLNKVNVAADVSLATVDAVNKVTAFGGLVGRVVVGSVDECGYTGNITVPDGFVVNEQKTYVGGLVGYISNPNGKITKSDFEGTIDFAGIVASTSTSDPYLLLGGIIGNNLGTVSGCKTKATNTKAITMDNTISYIATIQNHSRKVYHMAQGGIAGQNSGTISGCTNSASTKNFVLTTATNGGAASNDNSRYYDLGGIVGLNMADGTVTGCTNSGLIESRSTPRIQKVGGVVGYNFGTVSSSLNDESGDLTFATSNVPPYNMRVGEVGGVIGNNQATTVSNVSNAGDITLTRTENNANVELKFGGVIGFTNAAIDGGNTKSISNTGNILDSYNGATVSNVLCFGGVIGLAEADVKNVINSGNVTFQLSAANVMSRLYMGGVVGEVKSSANIVLSGCTNSGEVYFNVNQQNAAHNGNYLGGIVGLFTTSASVTASISSCANSGYIHSNCDGTSATVSDINIGGIAGALAGSSSVSISGCNNNNSAESGHENDGKVYLLVGSNSNNSIGGILGYSLTSFTMSTCTNNGLVTFQLNTVIDGVSNSEGTSLDAHVGGVVGCFADDKTASINGINNGEVFFDVNDKGGTASNKAGNFKDTFAGGILAKGSGATLSGCTNGGYVHGGNSIRHNGSPNYVGGIVAYLTGNSQILNCSNTGNVTNVDNNNTDTIGATPLTGGIAGYVEGTSNSSRITVGGTTGCSVDATINGNRGWVAGAIAYAKYSEVSSCTVKKAINCAARQAGGVIGKAEYCAISSSSFKGTSMKANNAHDNLMGGIVAQMDNTTVDGCYSYVTSLLCNTPSNNSSFAGGAIVGVSGSGNTIQNCRYKATINSATANIAGSGTFSGSGNVADL